MKAFFDTLKIAAQFRNTGEDFSAFHDAQEWCRDRNISMGSMQRDQPIGLMVGDYCVAKWRGLNDMDKCDLDGVITFRGGGARHGDVTIRMSPAALTSPTAPTPSEQ